MEAPDGGLGWVAGDSYHATINKYLRTNRCSFFLPFFCMLFLEYNHVSGICETKSKMIFLTHCAPSDGISPPSFPAGRASFVAKAGQGGFCCRESPPPLPSHLLCPSGLYSSSAESPLLSLDPQVRKEGGQGARKDRLIGIPV